MQSTWLRLIFLFLFFAVHFKEGRRCEVLLMGTCFYFCFFVFSIDQSFNIDKL